METIKIVRKIKNSMLKIKELEKFNDRTIELEIKIREVKKNKNLSGTLKKYANKQLKDIESDAWELAVQEKNENYRR